METRFAAPTTDTPVASEDNVLTRLNPAIAVDHSDVSQRNGCRYGAAQEYGCSWEAEYCTAGHDRI
jgi:hypothetical protein